MILFGRLAISDIKLMFPERSAMFQKKKIYKTRIIAKGPENRMSPVINSTLTAHSNTHSACA